MRARGLLAPRAFGELAVKTMESMDNPQLEYAIIAFARRFSVPGKTCSLLMLDREQDYKQFSIERGKDKQKLSTLKVTDLLEQISFSLKKSLQSPKSSFSSFWKTLQSNSLVQLKQTDNIDKLLKLLSIEDFAIDKKELRCRLHTRFDVPTAYLQSRKGDRKEYQAYLNEAERRLKKGFKDDYIRCLSSIVEQEPGRSAAFAIGRRCATDPPRDPGSLPREHSGRDRPGHFARAARGSLRDSESRSRVRDSPDAAWRVREEASLCCRARRA